MGKQLISIGFMSFYNCQNLEGTLIIPDSVINIERRAFTNCKKLEQLVLCTKIKSLVNESFLNCSNLSEYTFIITKIHINQNYFHYCLNYFHLGKYNQLVELFIKS